MRRGFIILIWGVVLTAMFLPGCKNNPAAPVKDKEYKKYLAYKQIFDNYGRVPADSSLAAIEGFLNSFPNDARAWAFYGRLLYDLQQPEKAVAAYQNAIASNPRYSVPYAGLGTLYNIRQQHDSAGYYLLKAVALRDSSAYTYVNLALLYMRTGQNEKCLAFADTTLQRADSLAPVYACLSYVFKGLHQPGKSDSLYNKAVQLGLRDTAAFNRVLQGAMPMEEYFRKNNY